jgi:GST-like protein
MTNDYVPPKVWEMQEDNGGKFSGINQPTAGARFEKDLPRGKHSLQLYSLATPNGVKVTIMLEELLELGIKEAEYDAYTIDILKGEQFGSGFVEINPNSKIPALVDHSLEPGQAIFESGAILLYLAEKFQKFCPKEGRQRTEVLNWLFWQMASAPYVGGGFGHFYAYAPSKMKYPIDRFTMETKRQLDVLDKQLAQYPYVAGDEYSIADMAIFPWYGALVKGMLYEAGEFLKVQDYTNVQSWADRLLERPAVLRGRLVNRTWGPEDQQMRERHCASDFDDLDVSFK